MFHENQSPNRKDDDDEKFQNLNDGVVKGAINDSNEDHEDFDEIYKILMPNSSFFSSINYESWETEMKKLLWLIDLLHYDHEGHVRFYDKRRGEISLQFIMSALDENILSSILHEFGEVSNAKIFWNILEIKYSMKCSDNYEVDEGIDGDSVDCLVTWTNNENDSIEVAMINEETDTKITFSDLVNSTKIDDGDECVSVDKPLCEYLVTVWIFGKFS